MPRHRADQRRDVCPRSPPLIAALDRFTNALHVPKGSSRIALACLSRTDGPAPIYPEPCPEPLPHPIARPTLHACPGQRCPEWRCMPVPDRGPGSWGSISCRNHRCSENVARKMNNPGESRGCPCISSSSWMPSSPVTKRLFPRTGTRLS
jgi:hypothetical protein